MFPEFFIATQKMEFDKSMAILRANADKRPVMSTVFQMWNYFVIGNYSQTLKLAEQFIPKLSSMRVEEQCAILAQIGLAHIRLRNVDSAKNIKDEIQSHLENYQLSPKDAVEELALTGIDANNAWYDALMGRYEEALSNIEIFIAKSDEFYENHDIFPIFEVCGMYALKSSILGIRGELNRAEKSTQEGLELATKWKNPYMIARNQKELGKYYWKKNQYDKALEYLESSKNYFSQSPVSKHVVEIMFDQMNIHLEMNNLDKAEELHNALLSYKISENNVEDQVYVLLAKAIFLKSGDRAFQQIEAQKILEAIMGRKELDFKLRLLTGLQLNETYLWEMHAMNSDVTLEKFVEVAENLRSGLNIQTMPDYYIDSLLLEARLALVQLDYSKAVNLLDQVESFIQKHGLDRLEPKYKTHRAQINQYILDTKQAIDESPSITERLEQSKIQTYLKQALKTYEALSQVK